MSLVTESGVSREFREPSLGALPPIRERRAEQTAAAVLRRWATPIPERLQAIRWEEERDVEFQYETRLTEIGRLMERGVAVCHDELRLVCRFIWSPHSMRPAGEWNWPLYRGEEAGTLREAADRVAAVLHQPPLIGLFRAMKSAGTGLKIRGTQINYIYQMLQQFKHDLQVHKRRAFAAYEVALQEQRAMILSEKKPSNEIIIKSLERIFRYYRTYKNLMWTTHALAWKNLKIIRTVTTQIHYAASHLMLVSEQIRRRDLRYRPMAAIIYREVAVLHAYADPVNGLFSSIGSLYRDGVLERVLRPIHNAMAEVIEAFEHVIPTVFPRDAHVPIESIWVVPP